MEDNNMGHLSEELSLFMKREEQRQQQREALITLLQAIVVVLALIFLILASFYAGMIWERTDPALTACKVEYVLPTPETDEMAEMVQELVVEINRQPKF